MSLSIKLYSPEQYRTGDEVKIVFEVTNQSSKPVHVLTWFTPLEGLRSSCLVVKSGEKTIEYDGIKVKRGKPSFQNFVEIPAGASISEKINLDEAYALPLRGNVRVEFDNSNLIAADLRSIRKKEDILKEARQRRVKKIDTIACSFKLNRTKKNIKTPGEQMRVRKKSKPGARGVAKDPNTEGMNEDEQKKMKAAHTKGHAMASASLAAISNDSKYKKWFGVHTAGRFAIAKSVYSKVKTGLEDKQFTYVNNGPKCKANDIAYTFDDSEKIFICKAFWSLGATGEDSQAGTVVHEHSHTSAHTSDHAYGQDDCIQLAKDNPDQAVDNADNFEYYSET